MTIEIAITIMVGLLLCAARADAHRYRIPALWLAVHECEQPGSWNHHGGRYSGGLGILDANYAAYRPAWGARDQADATPQAQVHVARVLYRLYGHRPWTGTTPGCVAGKLGRAW